MDTSNLIMEALMMTNRHDYGDDCLSDALESQAALLAGLPADPSEHQELFI